MELLNNADMTLVGEFFSKTAITRELPAQVEMAAFDQLDDILHWADFIAIDVPLQKLSVLGNLIHNTGQETDRNECPGIGTHQHALRRNCRLRNLCCENKKWV